MKRETEKGNITRNVIETQIGNGEQAVENAK